jgi:hypothetical protein
LLVSKLAILEIERLACTGDWEWTVVSRPTSTE